MIEKLHLTFLISYYLIIARFTSFKNMAPRLGKECNALLESPHFYSSKELKTLAHLRYAIPRIARHLPWECLCLPQAYACARILQNYNISYVFCLGATFLQEKGQTFAAHAWIECQGKVIVGGQSSHEKFSNLPIYYIYNASTSKK